MGHINKSDFSNQISDLYKNLIQVFIFKDFFFFF